MRDLYIEPPPKTPTLGASDPPKKKPDNEFDNPAFIIVPSVLGGLMFLFCCYMLIKHFTENVR